MIKEVAELMKRSDLTEFELEEENFKLRITRGGQEPQAFGYFPAHPPAQPGATPPPFPAEAGAGPQSGGGAEEAEEKNVEPVTSPMVGTFYRSPSPDSDPFVDVGSKVGAESVVCIIEAMKVMNEIQAEISGTITEVLVENGEAVEYGQPLFKVKTG